MYAEITENTLQAIPAITDPSQDGYHDTSTEADTADTAAMWDLTNTNRGVFDKSHIHQASSARRLVIEATCSL